ncbi:hypothetical protein ACH5RR_007319 [Cinchona calisaya]|uniref:Uncharacterized protein n=1 Tax=Cinchona calisaya TaxID=153742 RepID=A0ABD3ARG2_9GENT
MVMNYCVYVVYVSGRENWEWVEKERRGYMNRSMEGRRDWSTGKKDILCGEQMPWMANDSIGPEKWRNYKREMEPKEEKKERGKKKMKKGHGIFALCSYETRTKSHVEH